jgi:hypothetical protein
VPQGEILRILLAYWNAVCDLLGHAENLHKVRTIANALLQVGELDAGEVRKRLAASHAPSAALRAGLAEALPSIRAAGIKLIVKLHGDYLSPSGMRLGSHVTLN